MEPANGQVRSHRDLIVWQKAMELAAEAYAIAALLPKHETYGLASQMRRAAVSVPANIAEGQARGTSKDYGNFLGISKGSLMELDTLLLLSVRLGYVESQRIETAGGLLVEISRMISVLRQRVVARSPNP